MDKNRRSIRNRENSNIASNTLNVNSKSQLNCLLALLNKDHHHENGINSEFNRQEIASRVRDLV